MTDAMFRFVRSHRNLTRAWQAVSANSRHSTSPYVRDEVKGFGGDEQRRIKSISGRIQQQTYKFSKARGVAIEKAGKPGKIRPIVISRVEDRIVQRCLLDALTSHPSLKEQAFQPFSFGGIPKRGKDELAGVSAAIQQLLNSVGEGATHVMIADIEGFFTKIPKTTCLELIAAHITDDRFLSLIEKGVAVDLENAQALWRHKESFPYGDIGVGQGNCLSPFLGNLILSHFDKEMNEGDCRCIRYVDDIIILAPSGRAASSRFRLAERLLARHGMKFALGKTSPVPIRIAEPFEYLGIEFCQEMLRPGKKARRSILLRANEVALKSISHMKNCKDAGAFNPDYNIPKTLNRISGMARGWAHHYSFCNDRNTINMVDNAINAAFLSYVEKAQAIAQKKDKKITAALLGYRGAAAVPFSPFAWPLP